MAVEAAAPRPRIDPRTGKQLPKSPGRPRTRGRKSKFDATIAARIIALVRGGNYPETAAAFNGVSPQTLRDWLYQGETGRTDALEAFARDLRAAEAAAEVAAVNELRRSPKEARRFLERRFAKRWGPKAEIALGTPNGPVEIHLRWSEAKPGA